MKINLKNVKIRQVTKGYEDLGEQGVTGLAGKLNIRPAYQREFIYNAHQRDLVIQSVRKNFPLNTMYWAVAGQGYELMDGQQRTVSISQYVNGDFSIDWDGKPRGFANLTSEEQKQILDYELSVYICKGTDKERLDWFKVINIASVELTDQELRNAIYTGPWLTDAKRWFSKTGAPAAQLGENLVKGQLLRQDILARALKWISRDSIEQYMADHQKDKDAAALWQYFQAVITWVNQVFPNQESGRVKLMRGLEWGTFYNEHKGEKLNPKRLEKRIIELIEDDEVDNKRGIYEFLLTGDERTLNLRSFDEKTKVKLYEKQEGICRICKKQFEFEEMEADHIVPWSKGGKTIAKNCQMLCIQDNRTKSGK